MSELATRNGPEVRSAATQHYSIVTRTECHPVAPSGAGGAGVLVWVRPAASVARTRTAYVPGAACHCQDHCRQVSADTVPASLAGRHGPSSTCTSTLAIPVCCAQATPATV